MYEEWPIDTPGRPVEMPPVLECRNHPLVPNLRKANRIFVMLLRTDRKSMEKALEYESKMQAPLGGPSNWVKQGEI